MMTEAPRAEEYYDPPNEMEFKDWTKSLGQLTRNAERWDDFYHTIRRADGMVLFIENFNKACLHSQVQLAAQETGLVSESPRTRTLVRPAQHSAHARPPLSMATPNANTFSHPSKLSQLWLSPSASLPTGRVHGQHPQLPHPRGAPPWIFKDYSQPYVTPLTKTSLTLGISGGSFEKKFENIRGRKSIGYELGVDVVENLVFPQAVEDKFAQIFGVSAGWPQERPMPARKVSQVRFFPAPIIDII